MRFLDAENARVSDWKKTTPELTDSARSQGTFRGRDHPFALPAQMAEQNLFDPVRKTAIEYFRREHIVWHQGQGGSPSTHLCDGQVCCVNFLCPFGDSPEALLQLFRPLFPDIVKPLDMDPCRLVSFEWIGRKNYLREHGRGGLIAADTSRTRGAFFTSADAAVRFRTTNGGIRIILIEWKYTEKYMGASLAKSPYGADRTKIYESAWLEPQSPISRDKVGNFSNLFYEPFFQFMRQQLLADGMEAAHELDAYTVSVLHLAPRVNQDFQIVTSPNLALKYPGSRAVDVWGKLLQTPNRFTSRSIECFFGPMLLDPPPELRRWREYITSRYSWASPP